MTEWQGAVLRAQLGRFPAQQARRAANADFLNREVATIPGVNPQRRLDGCTSQGNYCYVVQLDDSIADGLPAFRDRVRTALIAEGIPLTTAYPAMHTLEMFEGSAGLAPRLRDLTGYPDYAKVECPQAVRLAESTLWFPTSVLMGAVEDAQGVVDAIDKVLSNRSALADVHPIAY